MSSAESSINKYPSWAPRFWHGMQSKLWFGELAKNRFNVDWNRLHVVLGVSSFMPISDLLALTQYVLFEKRIRETQLTSPPIFVLGHWRSGTTLLHELLTLDQRYTSPTTLQCFVPAHFLLTEGMVTRFGGFLLPDKRPMDNMKAGWSLPQEDEFALMNLGAPTPYTHMMFPQHDFVEEGTLSAETFPPEKLGEWKRLLDWFLKAITYKHQKPIILKSPPHTGRIKILREMYPDAKFIHISRDPRKLYPSTMKLWRSLEQVQGLQKPTPDDKLQGFVLRCLSSMYDSFEKGRVGLSDNQIIDVKYEDLAADSISVVERIYDQLELGNFEAIRQPLLARKESEKEYKTNKFGMPPETERMVLDAWAPYAAKYGYA